MAQETREKSRFSQQTGRRGRRSAGEVYGDQPSKSTVVYGYWVPSGTIYAVFVLERIDLEPAGGACRNAA
jgi:hypothetical protein